MSKLNDFFEKKKQKSKGLGELSGSKRPTIGSFKLNSVESSISSVISEGNADEWFVSTETKETSDLFIGGKNLSAEGLQKTSNPQMVVGIKTSKPDFDSNIWKSKSCDGNTQGMNASSGKSATGEDADEKINTEESENKPKETLKYNIRARLAARGEKVDFLSSKDAINSMPTLAAAMENVSKPKCSNAYSPANTNLYNTNTADKETGKPQSGKGAEDENNNDANNDDSLLSKGGADVGNDKAKLDEYLKEDNTHSQKQQEISDMELIKKLRNCDISYLNNDILFNCIIDIEQSKLKYSEIVRDF